MNPLSFLIAGHNIPFLAALGSCMLLALLQILGGFGQEDGDADADGPDVDADADGDIDLDADADGDIDADPDIDIDGDGDIDTDLDTGDLHAPADLHPHSSNDGHGGGVLAALGIGRVPLMLVMMGFLGSFGAIGLLANAIIASVTNIYPDVALIPVLLVSMLLALPLTGRLSGIFARLAPRSSTAITFQQLVGRAGVVSSPRVSHTYGRVTVRDAHGSVHTVYAVVEVGESLPERTEVALVRYDEQQRRFVVAGLGRVGKRKRVDTSTQKQ